MLYPAELRAPAPDSFFLNQRRPLGKCNDFTGLLVAFGSRHRRTSGSHWIYRHAKVPRPLGIQPRGGQAKPYQIARFLAMVEEYGLTMEREG